MKIPKLVKTALVSAGLLSVSACSVFGNPGVEIAPYKVLKKDGDIEIRSYDSLVLVSTPMDGNMENQGGAFNRLFQYISGDNTGARKIEMTAPVIMKPESAEGEKISMTAPVLINQDEGSNEWTMSFVLPAKFDYETAPVPKSEEVKLTELKNFDVAAIRFSGRLRGENTRKHKALLEQWLEENDYTASGTYQTAGYNPPWTLPQFRRNEVIIPVNIPN